MVLLAPLLFPALLLPLASVAAEDCRAEDCSPRDLSLMQVAAARSHLATGRQRTCRCHLITRGARTEPSSSVEGEVNARLIRKFSRDEPYNLSWGVKGSYSQDHQDERLWPILSAIKGGFFVESGAFDGESMSNTLAYEQRLNWTGLLVEPFPQSFELLRGKHRKAYLFNGALSASNSIEHMQFQSKDAQCGTACAGFQDFAEERYKTAPGRQFPVLAVPLEDLLRRIGRNTVDFWSLDIEGAEAAVLHGTDLSKFEVGVLLIEMNKGEKNNAGVEEVMQKFGFKKVGTTNLDGIYVNPSYFEKRSLPVPSAI